MSESDWKAAFQREVQRSQKLEEIVRTQRDTIAMLMRIVTTKAKKAVGM